MNNSAEIIKTKLIQSLTQIVVSYTESLKTLRTGVASLHLLDHIKVEAYGDHLPLNQLATLSLPEPNKIILEPWDKGTLKLIEKSILKSGLHLTVQTDSDAVNVIIPPLTEELRKDIAKELKQLSEKAKISVRNTRRDANDHLKLLHKEEMLSEDMLKNSLDDVQKLINKYIEEIDILTRNKEKSILNT